MWGKTHLNIKWFKCTVSGCKESFITKGHLLTHVYSHSPEKHECLDCQKSYSRITRLREHCKRTGHVVKVVLNEDYSDDSS